jgi:Flp pilus assembly protein TadD
VETAVTSSRSAASRPRLAALLVAAGAFVAYSNSFHGEFVYDDLAAIVGNPSLRRLSWEALQPPPGVTTSGRPLVNFTFAVDHALGGGSVVPFHVTNLLIHTAAGLALLGLVRRTLLQPGLPEWLRGSALPCATAVALLWTVHPLQTESVTYVVQRVESLMGLCFLLTLYAFARSTEDPRPVLWRVLAVAACAAGAGCKEVIALAPLIVLAYDRAFVSGSVGAAVRRHRGMYAGLAASWLLVLALVASTGWNRGGTVGPGVGVGAWDYGLTQFRALTRYLQLSLWPAGLAFDYGTFWEISLLAVAPYAVFVWALVCATAWGLWRVPRLGFLGVAFFLPLAPTSLLPGTTQMIVEHRMYLSLAPVLMLAVLPIFRHLGRFALPVCAAAAVALGVTTFDRNRDYRTGLGLWADTVAKVPANARARCNLAIALVAARRPAEALAHYTESLRLAPASPDTRYNYALALARLGRPQEAEAQYREALALQPEHAEARCNLGALLLAGGRPTEALRELEAARRLRPRDLDVMANLGAALAQSGQPSEALPYFAEVLAARPADADVHFNYANALLTLGRRLDAVRHYEHALRLQPGDPDFRRNLEIALRER